MTDQNSTTPAAQPTARPPVEMTIHQLPTGSYQTRAAFAFVGGRFSDQRDFAATAVLVRHPAGDVLIDAGFGVDAEKHIGMLPAFRRSAHELGVPASRQLDRSGYDRAGLRGVILTHSHWDHVSGLDSLRTPVYVTAEEQEYGAAARDDRIYEHVIEGHEIRTYTFDGPPYLGFSASHDFYGDGSLVIVPAAGHTSGSVIVFVTLPAGPRYAFIGDLTWQLDGIARRAQRPWLMRKLADTDPARIRHDLDLIAALPGDVRIVPAHDPRAYEGIPLLLAAPADRQQAGRATYARNFGVDEQTAERLMTERAGAAYVAEAFEAAGGPGWQGGALTDRDRSVAVIAAFVATHVIDDRLSVYLDVARRNGVDDDGLTQLMILLTAYVGQPAPSAAMSLIRRAGRV